MGATVLKDCFQMEDLIKIGDFRKELPKPVQTDAIFPVYMVLLGTWWFTRGIEASAAKRRDVRLATAVNEVSWNLPASKRDPKALGEERTHGCLCEEMCARALCPYHRMEEWLEVLKDKFGEPIDAEADNLPLFPTHEGKHLSKEATVRAVREVMGWLGEALTKKDGKGTDFQRFGEHVMRVAGAQFFARRGIELFMIQLYARWGSSAILRYVNDAPLKTQSKVAGKLAAAMGESPSIGEVQRKLRAVTKKGTAEDLESACKKLIEKSTDIVRPGELQALVKRVEVLEEDVDKDHKYVINTETMCVHKVYVWSNDLKPSKWKTVCNWYFSLGKENYEWLKSAEDAKTCDRCWRRTECDKGNLKRGDHSKKPEVADETSSKSSEPEDDWDDHFYHYIK